MAVIELKASAASLSVRGPLPVLTKNQQKKTFCRFEVDEDWNGLDIVAVFYAVNNRTKTVRKKVDVRRENWDSENSVAVPAAVMKCTGDTVYVGICGGNAGSLEYLPSIRCAIGTVKEGADPEGGEKGEDATPLWVQMKKEVGNLDNLVTEDKSSVVAAINEAVQTGAQKLPISVADGALCITYEED